MSLIFFNPYIILPPLINNLPQDYNFRIDHGTAFSTFINNSTTFPTFDTISRTIIFGLPKTVKYLDLGTKSLNISSTGITIVCKLQPLSNAASSERIIDTGDEFNNYLTLVYTSFNKLRLLVRNSVGTTLCDLTTVSALSLSKYSVIVVRIASSIASVWIDGVKAQTSIVPNDRTVSFRIGIDPYNSVVSQMPCNFKQLAFFNRGLTDAEIISLS